MLVFVLSKEGKALMPCSSRKARLLLKEGKAKVMRRTPFTIKLLFGSSGYKQDTTLGIDTGSSVIGSAVVTDAGKVLYISEVTIRNDISDKMKQRSKYRRNRRNRKTRYREVRFGNRKNSIRSDRFSPTMRSKIDSHLKEIEFVKSILPIKKVILETAKFDTHALKNPEVLSNKWMYQRGINYGFANVKAYVLDRDRYVCQYCKGKSKDSRLEVHHIVFRSDNGSDSPDNLITLCKRDHDELHNGGIVLKGGKVRGQLRYATQMNSIRVQLMDVLPNAEETFGFVTKEHRQLLDLPKEHYIDAVVIASEGREVSFKNNLMILKRCVNDGDYQQTRGIRSEQKIPTGKIQGFRKFDKVKYLNKEYFIKGRMSIGYVILMDLNGDAFKLKPMPKFSKMIRVSARKSWIMDIQQLTKGNSSHE